MTSHLFSPLQLRSLELPNRIAVSPMCQYHAEDGCMSDWHLAHLGSLALSGAGLLMIESTGVRADGRISPRDVGLYSDANEAAMARVLGVLRAASGIAVGVQLGHAGRKASTRPPWEGRGPVPEAEGGWSVIGPSAVAFTEGWHVPRAMTRDDMDAVRDAFVAAAGRAARLGLDHVELHFAHGYLMSSFLSPLSNRRGDDYGGSRDNRMRFPLEVAAAVRAAWPEERPLAVRVNGSDFVDGGWTGADAAAFAVELAGLGVDLVTVSGGGIDPAQQVDPRPGYQLPFAEGVREASGLPTASVGMILTPAQAEAAIAEGRADVVVLARGMLFDPRWPYHAAHVLGAELPWPPQYERASPANWPGADALLRGLAPAE